MKIHPKISKITQQFWKTPKSSKTPKPRFQNMKCMKNERLEAYQEKKILKKLEETFEDQDWSDLREFGRENREQSREISSEIRFGSHKEAYIEHSVKLDRWGVERCRGSCQGRYREKCLSTVEVSTKYRATTHQIQEQKLDRSTKCREAMEEAGAFSIDPPGIKELSGLRYEKAWEARQIARCRGGIEEVSSHFFKTNFSREEKHRYECNPTCNSINDPINTIISQNHLLIKILKHMDLKNTHTH